jgi:hypothetical protein
VDLFAAHPNSYPLAASGGVFLTIAGLAILLGALRFQSRNVVLCVGGALAAVVTALLAPSLTARAGVPTLAQIIWLAAAVIAEIVFLALLIRRVWPRGERTVVLMVLGVVALHFLPMAPAFGPPMVLLAVLCGANVTIAIRSSGYSVRAAWAIDGALKLAIGALMVLQIT